MKKEFLCGLAVGCIFTAVASSVILKAGQDQKKLIEEAPIALKPFDDRPMIDTFAFGRAFAADFTLTLLEREEIQEAKEVSQMHIDNFIEEYEKGINVKFMRGRMKQLYLKYSTSEQTEPGGTGQSH